MNKKQEIKKLKRTLRVCQSKLILLQKLIECEESVIKENSKLRMKNELLEKQFLNCQGVLFNYQTQYLAP